MMGSEGDGDGDGDAGDDDASAGDGDGDAGDDDASAGDGDGGDGDGDGDGGDGDGDGDGDGNGQGDCESLKPITCAELSCPSDSTCVDSDEGARCTCSDGAFLDAWGTRCVTRVAPTWTQDFESGFGDWSIDGGVWNVGAPTAADGPSARSGAAVAGTVIAGNYPSGTGYSYLISPPIDLPAASEMPRLRAFQWHDLRASDVAGVSIRTFNPDNGTWSAWNELDRMYGSSDGWSQRIIQLSPYAKRRVQVSFWIHSANSAQVGRPGFYIDDVSLETGAMEAASAGFEAGFKDWSAQGGAWNVAAPTASDGPQAHGGNTVAGTVPSGNAPSGIGYTRVVSPVVDVPRDAVLPRLRAWQWHDLRASDVAGVSIRVYNPDTGAWSSWDELDRVHGSSDGWTQRIIQLSPYRERRVQIAFWLHAANSNQTTRPGFYIDDVSFEVGLMRSPTTRFETGFCDWSAEGGAWNVGAPTANPGPSAHEGTMLAGTVLSGNAPSGIGYAYLVSPAMDIPAANSFPRLRAWQWHDLRASDVAGVSIRVYNPDTGAWSSWSELDRMRGSSDGWAQRIIQLSAYQQRRVQVAFWLHAANTTQTTRPGFYLDSVRFETGAMRSLTTGFEDGFGDWSSEGGAWMVGEPTFGDGPMPHGGKAVAGTVLSGNAPSGIGYTYLVSPVFQVAAAASLPSLRAQLWHDLRAADVAGVSIRAFNPDNGAWSKWTELDRMKGASGGWTQHILQLSSYAGRHVQVAYWLHAANSTQVTRPGFYLDDVSLQAN